MSNRNGWRIEGPIDPGAVIGGAVTLLANALIGVVFFALVLWLAFGSR